MNLFEIIFSFSTLLFIIVIVVCLLSERRTKISPVPTLPWIKTAMIKALEDHCDKTQDMQIAELGSGWGGISFAAAKAFPTATITGYELSFFPYWFARMRLAFSRAAITFHPSDFMAEDFSKFNIVICYLSPHHMAQLKPKFENELQKGTLVISNAFPIPNWTPIETHTTNLPIKIPVYVYRV